MQIVNDRRLNKKVYVYFIIYLILKYKIMIYSIFKIYVLTIQKVI